MAEEEKVIPCPVCGSIDIGSVFNSNDICGPGFRSWKVHDVCNNCGVFLSLNRKEKSICLNLDKPIVVTTPTNTESLSGYIKMRNDRELRL